MAAKRMLAVLTICLVFGSARSPGARPQAPDARCHGGCGSRSVWRGVTERKGSRIHRRRARGHRWRGGNDPRGHRGGRLPRQGLHRPALRSLGYGLPRSIRPRSARCPTAAWCSGRPRVRSGFRRVADAGEYRIPTTPTGSTPTIGAVVPAMLTWARCSRTWRSSTLRFGTTTLRATSRCRSASTATTGRRATWRRTWNSAPLCTPSTSVRAIRCSSRRSTAGTATAATMPRTTARAWRCGTW